MNGATTVWFQWLALALLCGCAPGTQIVTREGTLPDAKPSNNAAAFSACAEDVSWLQNMYVRTVREYEPSGKGRYHGAFVIGDEHSLKVFLGLAEKSDAEVHKMARAASVRDQWPAEILGKLEQLPREHLLGIIACGGAAQHDTRTLYGAFFGQYGKLERILRIMPADAQGLVVGIFSLDVWRDVAWLKTVLGESGYEGLNPGDANSALYVGWVAPQQPGKRLSQWAVGFSPEGTIGHLRMQRIGSVWLTGQWCFQPSLLEYSSFWSHRYGPLMDVYGSRRLLVADYVLFPREKALLDLGLGTLSDGPWPVVDHLAIPDPESAVLKECYEVSNLPGLCSVEVEQLALTEGTYIRYFMETGMGKPRATRVSVTRGQASWREREITWDAFGGLWAAACDSYVKAKPYESLDRLRGFKDRWSLTLRYPFGSLTANATDSNPGEIMGLLKGLAEDMDNLLK